MHTHLKKLHVSEVLLILQYALMISGYFVVRTLDLRGAAEDTVAILALVSVVSYSALSVWSMAHRKAISPVLWPLYLWLGFSAGSFFHGMGLVDSGPGVMILLAMGVIFAGIPIALQFVFVMIYATKDFPKFVALVIGGFVAARLIDGMFITSDEVGEKGRAYYLSKYPAWRVLVD